MGQKTKLQKRQYPFSFSPPPMGSRHFSIRSFFRNSDVGHEKKGLVGWLNFFGG